MSSLQHSVLRFVDEQLDAIFGAPGMWGSDEAVELQVLQLLEFRSVTLRPELEKRAPRTILDAYQELLAAELPGFPPMPLFALLERCGRKEQFIPLLWKLTRQIIDGMTAEDPFLTHDLVLRLTLRPEARLPRASSLSAYYDALQRVLRALARERGTRGRANQELEEAIDFAMPDVTVMPANGAPAQVIMPLDQTERERAGSVRRALVQIAAASDWAADIDSPVDMLKGRLPQGASSELVAAQTLRLMPSAEADVRAVEIGGRLLGRAEPVIIRPAYAARMVEVLKEETAPQPFDEIGDVRALDIDQRSVRIKTSAGSFRCWLERPELVDAAQNALGRRAHVTGRLYKAAGSPAIVVIERFRV